MSDHQIPQAQESEAAVLSECLLSPPMLVKARGLLSDDDFFNPLHAEIWLAMRTIHEDRGVVDPIVLMAQLRRPTAELLGRLSTAVGAPDIAWHLERIVETALQRRMQQVGTHLIQVAATEAEPVSAMEDAILQLRLIQAGQTPDEPSEIDFLDIVARSTEQHWVIPGVLGKGDRLILTAPEGWGKSSLIRQIAATTAAGVHCFKPQARIEPAKVLVIDAENPEQVNTDEYRRVYDNLDQMRALPQRGMLSVEESGPMNLLDPRQAVRLAAMVERIQPKLITIGPIYQLHEEDPNEEGPARKLSAVLDKIRRASGAALITEAHSPHGDGRQPMIRPIGASLWKRWPEFGLCLLPVPQPHGATDRDIELSLQMRESALRPWRGARASRHFPKNLCLGGRLPWEPYDKLVA